MSRRTRAMLFIAIAIGHALLIMILLRYTVDRPTPAANEIIKVLDLVVAPAPAAEPPPVPDPPQELAPSVAAPKGGSDAGAPPSVPAPLDQPAVAALDTTSVISSQPHPLPSTATAPTVSAGTGQGVGDGSDGHGRGDGRGNQRGDGTGTGGTSLIGIARWARIPTRRELNRHIPLALREKRISGEAYLACRVKLNRRVRDCRLLKEVPAGSGFGTAALAASPNFRIFPAELNKKPVDLAWVVVPIIYDYQE